MKVRTAFILTMAALLPLAATAAEPSKVLSVDQTAVERTIPEGPDTTLNQAPNQVNGLFSDIGCDICTQGVQIIGENFTISTGGLGYNFDQVIFWGGYYPNDVPVAAPFEVGIYPDAGGAPGAVATCSNSGVVPSADVLTGVVLFGVSEHMITLDVPPCNLADGTYWLVMYTDTGVGTDDLFWETGTLDATNGIVGSVWSPTNPPAPWNIDAATDLSVQITGTIVPVELQSFSIE